MTEASYTAWDDKQYVWPPPEGWYEASDGKWWPEGYGPPGATAADNGTAAADAEAAAEAGPAGGFGTAGAFGTAGDAAASVDVDGMSDAGTGADATAGSIFDEATTEFGSAGVDVNEDSGAGTDVDEATAEFGSANGDEFGSSLLGDAAGSAGSAFDATVDSATGATDSAIGAGRDSLSGLGGRAADVADEVTGAADGLTEAEGAAVDRESSAPSRTDLGSSGLAFDGPTGAGAFSSAPMEMNDLSSGSAADLAEGASGLRDRASDAAESVDVGDLSGGAGDAVDQARANMASSLPDINDVMPTQEMSSESILGRTDAGEGALDDLDVGSAASRIPGAEDLNLGDLGAPGFSAETERFEETESSPDDNLTQVVPTELPAAPADFTPPPPGSDQGFAAPVDDPQISPLDRGSIPPPPGSDAGAPPVDPFGAPQTDAFGSDPAQAPGASSFADYAAPPSGGPQPGMAPPPGQLPPPGDFGAGSGPAPSQAGFAAPPSDGSPPPAGDPTGGGPLAPDLGVDSQAMLDARPQERSRGLLLILVGVLALVAICVALFLAFRGGDDSDTDDAVAIVGPGSFDEPHPRSTGVVVFYPDGDTDQRWVVEVLEPVRDVTAEIVTDDSVAGPEAGEIFAATRIRVRNEAGVDGASLDDLDFNAVNAAGEVIDRESNQCSFSVNDLDYAASVGLGTQVEGAVCWELPASDLDGLRLGIESDKVSGRVHINLG